MDQNPYESPRSDEPLKSRQIVKRGIGVGLILLLTPPAVVIAVLACCTVNSKVDLQPMMFYVGCPLAMLTGLMIWASVLELRKDRITRAPRRIGCLLAIPVVVLVATVVGFWLAMIAPIGPDIYVIALFWLVPGVTLRAIAPC